MIGAATAIIVTGTSMYGVVIAPMQSQIARLIDGREKDHDQLAALYTSIQTNDEYKKTIRTELEWLRADLLRIGAQANTLDEVHKDRAGQAAQIADLQARWERLDHHNDEIEKTLQGQIDGLRDRMMLPVAK
jgi:DNA repair exonuclease SbcCD ATPase subunit